MQKNAGEAGSVEEWAKSRAACAMPLILGGKAKVKEIFSLIPPAKTTD